MTHDELFQRLFTEPLPPAIQANVVLVCRDSGVIELLTDVSAATYSEHIRGEGADICLIRELDTNRVVGVRLPTRHTSVSVDVI